MVAAHFDPPFKVSTITCSRYSSPRGGLIIVGVSKWTIKAVPSDTAGKLSEAISRPGDTHQITGGGAKRSRRKRHDRNTRPERAPDRDWFCCELWSGVPAGTRTIFLDLSRWLRFAPPPANVHRASSARRSSPAVSQASALQRLRRSDLCTCFNHLLEFLFRTLHEVWTSLPANHSLSLFLSSVARLLRLRSL